MKWVVASIGVLVAIGAVVWLVGALLPSGHTASRRAHYNRSSQTIYATIRDFAGYPEWRPGLTSVEVLPAVSARGTQFREIGSDGNILFEVLEESPPHRMVVRIADEELPFGGTWTYVIEDADEGATVTITENGVVHNPVFRFISRFVFTHHATIESCLTALGRSFDEEVEPEEPS